MTKTWASQISPLLTGNYDAKFFLLLKIQIFFKSIQFVSSFCLHSIVVDWLSQFCNLFFQSFVLVEKWRKVLKFTIKPWDFANTQTILQHGVHDKIESGSFKIGSSGNSYERLTQGCLTHLECCLWSGYASCFNHDYVSHWNLPFIGLRNQWLHFNSRSRNFFQ